MRRAPSPARTVSKPGKFEQADSGTVFLDEIGDVPANIQVKLLRILQERQFERLGSNVTRNVDVRVVAATNVDLRAALEQGRFREDLYYRLNVVPINVPPLRERKEDIPFLAMHFVQKLRRSWGASRGDQPGGDGPAGEHSWPGNVRELENTDRAQPGAGFGRGIAAADIRIEAPRHNHNLPRIATGPAAAGRRNAGALGADDDPRSAAPCKWQQSQAARMLGLTRNALRYRLSQMGLEGGGNGPDRERRSEGA